MMQFVITEIKIIADTNTGEETEVIKSSGYSLFWYGNDHSDNEVPLKNKLQNTGKRTSFSRALFIVSNE